MIWHVHRFESLDFIDFKHVECNEHKIFDFNDFIIFKDLACAELKYLDFNFFLQFRMCKEPNLWI